MLHTLPVAHVPGHVGVEAADLVPASNSLVYVSESEIGDYLVILSVQFRGATIVVSIAAEPLFPREDSFLASNEF